MTLQTYVRNAWVEHFATFGSSGLHAYCITKTYRQVDVYNRDYSNIEENIPQHWLFAINKKELISLTFRVAILRMIITFINVEEGILTANLILRLL